LGQPGEANKSGSTEQSMMQALQSILEMMMQLLQGMSGQQSGGKSGGSSPASSNPTPSSFAPTGEQSQAELGNLFSSLGEFAGTLGEMFQGGQLGGSTNFGGNTVQA
jgi:hypothetical protein